ncbi:MAG: ArgE/DapE family deacylase [Methanospirillaceae archaeon]|nr:ArgE/DapE family deacylase [Methanospirillaceae archaeon]
MNVAEICSELVKIRSENPPGDTEEVIVWIQSYLEDIGIHAEVISGKNGHCNLITTGSKSGLMFCGHVDVVPVIDDGWDFPPFSGTITDGFVYGRGSTDMKGGCAAILAALGNLIKEGKQPDVDLAFVCDEEGKGTYGMQYLLAKNYVAPKECLIAEPSPYSSPMIGEKGLIRLQVTFHGEPGHSSLHPVVGRSAIIEACSFLKYIESFHQQEFVVDPTFEGAITRTIENLSVQAGIPLQEANRILRHVMYNPGVINGGEKVNVVAQRCCAEYDLRIPWGCDPHTIVHSIRKQYPHADITVEDIAPASFTPPCRLIRETCTAIEAVYHEPALPCVTWAATDARHMREAGIAVIEYGPGDLALLHARNERVAVSHLKNATGIFMHIIKAYTDA